MAFTVLDGEEKKGYLGDQFLETSTRCAIRDEPVFVRIIGRNVPSMQKIQEYILSNKGYEPYKGRTGSRYLRQEETSSILRAYENADEFGINVSITQLIEVPSVRKIELRIADGADLESQYPGIDQYISMSDIEKKAALLERAITDLEEKYLPAAQDIQ